MIVLAVHREVGGVFFGRLFEDGIEVETKQGLEVKLEERDFREMLQKTGFRVLCTDTEKVGIVVFECTSVRVRVCVRREYVGA